MFGAICPARGTGAGLVLPAANAAMMNLHLPPCSPELNPVETVWAYLRGNKPGNRMLDTYDAILDACCDAWNWLTAQPERITAIGSRQWAQVIP